MKIFPNCYIGEGAHIGKGSRIHAGVKVHAKCMIGANCVLHSGVVIGADGFGFSDTRAAARRFFHIDGPSLAVRTLQVLAARGEAPAEWARTAAEKYRLLDIAAGASGNAGGDA